MKGKLSPGELHIVNEDEHYSPLFRESFVLVVSVNQTESSNWKQYCLLGKKKFYHRLEMRSDYVDNIFTRVG